MKVWYDVVVYGSWGLHFCLDRALTLHGESITYTPSTVGRLVNSVHSLCRVRYDEAFYRVWTPLWPSLPPFIYLCTIESTIIGWTKTWLADDLGIGHRTLWIGVGRLPKRGILFLLDPYCLRVMLKGSILSDSFIMFVQDRHTYYINWKRVDNMVV